MTSLYFWMFVGLLVIGLAHALWRPSRMYEFPAFMTLAFGAFILPQAISLLRFPGEVSEEAVDTVLLMTCVCLGACFLGYRLKPNVALLRWTQRPVDLGRLFHVGLFFIAVSYGFRMALGSTEVEFAETGGMTGRGTILLFFQQLCYPGFAICLLCAVRRPTIINVLASAAGFVPLLQAVVIARREGTALIVLIVMMAFYYQRRWVPPRWVFLSGLLAAMLFIPATGTYRQLAGQYGVGAVRRIDFVENFKKFISEESPILELRNAAAVIESTRETGHYEYGAAYWNHLVFRFVPAQLVGKRLKDALKVNFKWDLVKEEMTETGFQLSRGSTVTGMGDSYQQFGYLGCLFFVLIAVVFKSLWQASQGRDAIFAQLLYMLSVTSAMRAVTHWTQDFLPGLLYFVIFLGLAMLYATTPTRMLARRARKNAGPERGREQQGSAADATPPPRS